MSCCVNSFVLFSVVDAVVVVVVRVPVLAVVVVVVIDAHIFEVAVVVCVFVCVVVGGGSVGCVGGKHVLHVATASRVSLFACLHTLMAKISED